MNIFRSTRMTCAITRSMVVNMPPRLLPLLNRRPGGFSYFV